MNEREVRDLIVPLTGGTSSCQITRAPEPSRMPQSFWTEAKPHKVLKLRDRQLIAAYFEVAARTGVPVRADGIPLDGGGYLHPDKAVMNAGLAHDWLDLHKDKGAFILTESGWRGIRTV
jgi:hypothetical protein